MDYTTEGSRGELRKNMYTSCPVITSWSVLTSWSILIENSRAQGNNYQLSYFQIEFKPRNCGEGGKCLTHSTAMTINAMCT